MMSPRLIISGVAVGAIIGALVYLVVKTMDVDFVRDILCVNHVQNGARHVGWIREGFYRMASRLSAQVAELRAAGCAEVFQEKASGAKTERAQLSRMITRLQMVTCWW